MGLSLDSMRILTFDVEEWFHILDNESTKTETEWSRYERRLEMNMDRILELLASKQLKATFLPGLGGPRIPLCYPLHS